MDDLLDMIVSDESHSQITDKIKEILFAKSAERVDAVRPQVSASLFGEQDSETDEDDDEDDENDDEDEDYTEEEE
jgi:hypothetical protein